jgi:hypothetical protein
LLQTKVTRNPLPGILEDPVPDTPLTRDQLRGYIEGDSYTVNASLIAAGGYNYSPGAPCNKLGVQRGVSTPGIGISYTSTGLIYAKGSRILPTVTPATATQGLPLDGVAPVSVLPVSHLRPEAALGPPFRKIKIAYEFWPFSWETEYDVDVNGHIIWDK